jgi:hypothetical protein
VEGPYADYLQTFAGGSKSRCLQYMAEKSSESCTMGGSSEVCTSHECPNAFVVSERFDFLERLRKRWTGGMNFMIWSKTASSANLPSNSTQSLLITSVSPAITAAGFTSEISAGFRFLGGVTCSALAEGRSFQGKRIQRRFASISHSILTSCVEVQGLQL